MKVYVGPYVACRYREAEFDVINFRTCVNEACVRNRKDNEQWGREVERFCGLCGQPTGLVPRNVPRRPRVTSVIGHGSGLHDAIGDGFRRIVVAGLAYAFREFDSYYVDLVDLTRADRDAEIKWFEETFAEPLRKLRAAYDASVHWGIIERED